MKKTILTLAAVTVLASCVSKKKYVQLQQEHGITKSQLTKTAVEKEELEAKFAKIEARVADYNSKINTLTEDNDAKLISADGVVISNNQKSKMRETLSKVNAVDLANAKTLKDSMNLALSYNLNKAIGDNSLNEDEDIAIDIEDTVVMISISDKLLFNTASYNVSSKADGILQKLADIINSEPSIEVMVEGHTDARSINTPKVSDNWDLSVLRATSIVRKLQSKYNVSPEKLIASGRSSYQPLASNETKEDRAKNRRTRIVILPNIDKFFALMASNE
ncbi:flagellar motor protein MotB [Cellulophaga sp. F20128]|uniref:OmpA/MotB family protein n=1 Tax=Cellulophaga sp. F20128 TaxID=2926413 RepID=UPI001FF276A4|nr:flagellar motor protein MotB [Cellulophaga sp. F20128]MCK0158914.1 flagellar motor protein MotB [Cellulophaga sp. F20128]